MQRGGGGLNDAERGEATGFGRNLRGLVGRWPDADVVLQGGMSDGLRDWDLWYVAIFLTIYLGIRLQTDEFIGVRLSSAWF